MKLSAIEVELQNQLKGLIKSKGYWSKDVLTFNAKLNLETALRINENVDKSFQPDTLANFNRIVCINGI